MFKRIIWATDGSELATRALALAARLCRSDGSHLHAVHVVETYPAGRTAGLPIRVDEDDLAARIQTQLRSLTTTGVRASVHLPHAASGTAARRIAEIAREVDADLIVVGTRGHSALAGAMLGSVTQRLLHVAPCPVLAVPPIVPKAVAPVAEPDDVMLTG